MVGYVLQQEELCRYLKHFGLEPKVLHINQKHLLKEMVVKHQPKHIFVAMSVWQQLAITDAWIQQHTSSTRFTVINQNPMLSPEPLGNSWCLSVNPLLPDNLVHVLTKPVSHDNLISPVDSEAKAPIAEETREQAENNGRLILVAEDHPINQQVIAKQLENIGVHADIVDNGVLALNALKDKRYGLLLTDCHMPEMDGYTLASSIRQIEQRKEELNQETQRLPIVALTANAVQGEDANCYAHGMDDFLVKPVSIKQMRLTIEKWLPAIDDSNPVRETDVYDAKELKAQNQEVSASSNSSPKDEEANEFSMLFQDIEQSFAEVEISNPSEPSQEVTPASPQDSFNLTNNQVIDYAALYDLFEDHDVVMTLLDEFAASFIEDNERIKTYWASKEYKELKTTAHRLKGAAKMVACDRIASPLAIIEARANDLVTEDTDLEQVESKIEASIEEVNSTFERFTEEINQLRQTKEKAYSYE